VTLQKNKSDPGARVRPGLILSPGAREFTRDEVDRSTHADDLIARGRAAIMAR